MTSLKAGIFVKPAPDVGRNLQIVQELDDAGVDTVWQTNNVLWPEPMTFYAAAAATTKQVRLGTSIIQIYPRHPAALVSQAQVIESLAPGRLRLGVGTSHRPRMEKNLGITMGSKPLTYLREYVAVLRGLLWEGRAEVHGEYINVSEHYPEGVITPPRTEISVSTLSPKSYHVAGEIADAAISWMAPIRYLVETGLSSLKEGAEAAEREVPPLIAHVPVAVTKDRSRAVETAGNELIHYGALPFYQRMFEAAGLPATDNNRTPKEVIDSIVVSGSPDEIRQKLESILAEGIGEVLLHPIIINDADKERRELAKIMVG
jgi:alkanesulfonate monooxygenase SsuD/methylene tetrahydromethanopterin reductase-like flavin-dependent oxidoreductase (luciferase family)